MKTFKLLEMTGIAASYLHDVPVLHAVDLVVNEHEVVTVIGSNGAGKSTLLHVASGLLQPTAGRVWFDGEDITSTPAHEVVAHGLVLSPSGRQIFPEMRVSENLRLGGYRYRTQRRRLNRMINETYERFSGLGERRNALAGELSGGMQQQLAIAVAMMSRPKLLMLDEPSMGLDPSAVDDLAVTIRGLIDAGTTILMVEKAAHLATSLSDRMYVMELGSVVLSGPTSELAEDPRVQEAYLGKHR